MNSLKADIKSWKTTVIGVLTGLAICAPQLINLLDGDPETVFQLAIFLSGLAAMGIGVFAKDGDKSSKKLGID